MEAPHSSMQSGTTNLSVSRSSSHSSAISSTECTAFTLTIPRRNGDTCLHYAAAYNSLDSMVLVVNFGGFELLLKKNKQGKRPIDIAEALKNYETFRALQKLERNVQFQNAILEREVTDLRSQAKRIKKGQVMPGNDKGTAKYGAEGQAKRDRFMQRNKLNVINE